MHKNMTYYEIYMYIYVHGISQKGFGDVFSAVYVQRDRKIVYIV